MCTLECHLQHRSVCISEWFKCTKGPWLAAAYGTWIVPEPLLKLWLLCWNPQSLLLAYCLEDAVHRHVSVGCLHGDKNWFFIRLQNNQVLQQNSRNNWHRPWYSKNRPQLFCKQPSFFRYEWCHCYQDKVVFSRNADFAFVSPLKRQRSVGVARQQIRKAAQHLHDSTWEHHSYDLAFKANISLIPMSAKHPSWCFHI